MTDRIERTETPKEKLDEIREFLTDIMNTSSDQRARNLAGAARWRLDSMEATETTVPVGETSLGRGLLLSNHG